jgi:hypothetical protein
VKQQDVIAIGGADTDIEGAGKAEVALQVSESHFRKFSVEVGGVIARAIIDYDYLKRGQAGQ